MALTVKWTKEAEKTYDAIIEYLERFWTEKEIYSFVQKTFKIIDQIEKNPFQFKASSIPQVRAALITKHNTLFYYVNEATQTIELYTFWDNRQEPDKRPY